MITKYLLSYLITGTRGGITRGRIIETLRKNPLNMNQLSKTLKLDYKTVQHHITVLLENEVISAIHQGTYGAMYHLSTDMEKKIDLFEEIWKTQE
jgi:DNA-binding transcriptional ArsR family regulator